MTSGGNRFNLLTDEAEAPAQAASAASGPPKQSKSKQIPANTNAQVPAPAVAPAPTAGAGGGRGGQRRENNQGTGHRPKREFDRHLSRTGRGKEVRKEGAGRGGWGSTAPAAVSGDNSAPVPEGGAQQPNAPTDGANAASPSASAPAPEPEPEEPVLGLDDFLKQKQANAVAGDVKAARQVVVGGSFKPGKEINAGIKNNEKSKKKADGKGGKKIISLDEFNSQHSAGGEAPAGYAGAMNNHRGGGNFRGHRGGGRGGGRGSNVNIIDSNAFPKLE